MISDIRGNLKFSVFLPFENSIPAYIPFWVSESTEICTTIPFPTTKTVQWCLFRQIGPSRSLG